MSNFTIFSHFALIPLEYSDLIGFAYVSGNRLPSWNLTQAILCIFYAGLILLPSFSYCSSHWCDLSARDSRKVSALQPHQCLTLGRCRALSAGDTQGSHRDSSCLKTPINLFPLCQHSQHSLSQHRPAQQLQPEPLAAKCPSLNPPCGPKAKDVLQ